MMESVSVAVGELAPRVRDVRSQVDGGRAIIAVRLDDHDAHLVQAVAEDLAWDLRKKVPGQIGVWAPAIVTTPFDIGVLEEMTLHDLPIAVATRSRWATIRSLNSELLFVDVKAASTPQGPFHHDADDAQVQEHLELDWIGRAIVAGLGFLDPLVSVSALADLRQRGALDPLLSKVEQRPLEPWELLRERDRDLFVFNTADEIASGRFSASDMQDLESVWTIVARAVESANDLRPVRAVVMGLAATHPSIASTIIRSAASSIASVIAASGKPLLRRIWSRLALDLHCPSEAAAFLLTRRGDPPRQGSFEAWGSDCAVDAASLSFGEPVLEALLLRTRILEEFFRQDRSSPDRAMLLLGSYELLSERAGAFPSLFHGIASGLEECAELRRLEPDRVGAIESRLDAVAEHEPFNRRFAVTLLARAIGRGDRNAADRLRMRLSDWSGLSIATMSPQKGLEDGTPTAPLSSTWLYVRHSEGQYEERFGQNGEDLNKADARYAEILAVDAMNIPAMTARASLAMKRGHDAAARHWLDRSLSIDPVNPIALLRKAQLEKDPELLTRCIVRDPYNVRFHTALAAIHRLQGDVASAQRVLDQAETFSGRNPYVVAERMALVPAGQRVPGALQQTADEMAQENVVVRLALLRRVGSTNPTLWTGDRAPLGQQSLSGMALCEGIRVRNTFAQHFGTLGASVWGAQLAASYSSDMLNRYTLELRQELSFLRAEDAQRAADLIATLRDDPFPDLAAMISGPALPNPAPQ